MLCFGVQHPNAAAAVFDQSGFLQRARHHRHAWTPHVQHLAKKFLRQHQLVAAGEVAHIEKPAAHAGFDRVTGVARRRLLRLRKQHLLMPDDERAEPLVLIGQSAQSVDLDGARAAGHLHNALVERHLAVERRGCVQDAVTAHHRGFDHRPDVQVDHEGDGA
jgi:hypothetical protein